MFCIIKALKDLHDNILAGARKILTLLMTILYHPANLTTVSQVTLIICSADALRALCQEGTAYMQHKPSLNALGSNEVNRWVTLHSFQHSHWS